MKFFYSIIMMLALSVSTAWAADYTGSATIQRISALEGGGGFILWGSWNNVDNCSNPAKWTVGFHSSDNAQSQNAKFSMALAAYLSGTTVELYVDGCNASGQPIVKGLYVPSRY